MSRLHRPTRFGIRAFLAIGALLGASSALAYDYPADLSDVQTEEDIYDLYYEGQIEQSELEQLLSLLQDPVDINSADRDRLYDLPGMSWSLVNSIIKRREKYPFNTLSELNLVSGMPPEVVGQISGFAVANKPLDLLKNLSGKAIFKMGWSPSQNAYKSVSKDDIVVGHNNAEAYENSLSGTKPPTASLKLQTKLKGWFDLGLVGTMSQGLNADDLKYRAELPEFRNTRGSSTEGQQKGTLEGYLTNGVETKFDLAKAYIHTPIGRGQSWSAILGSYRIGFGMGTILDNTGREFPNGWRADKQLTDSASATGSAPNFRDDPGFFGVAASLHRLTINSGKHWFSGHIFGSMIDRNSYQTIENNAKQADYPSKSAYNSARSLYICERDKNGNCSYRINPATGEGSYKLSQITILDAFRETTAGGNLNFHWSHLTQVGLSAYFSKLDMNLSSGESPDEASKNGDTGLRLTNSSPYPSNADFPMFGAIGGHVFFGLDDFMLRAEYGRSFNGTSSQQGNALQTRAYYNRGIFDVELGFRWYDKYYDNRWASPKAASDMLDGNRARDELGFDYRVGVTPSKGKLTLKAKGDIWRRAYSQCVIALEDSDDPDSATYLDEGCLAAEAGLEEGYKFKSDPVWNMTQEFMVAYSPIKGLKLTFKPAYSNHDLSKGGRDETYQDGRGMKFSLFGKIDYMPKNLKWLKISTAYQHTFEDDTANGEFKPKLYNAALDAQDTNYLWAQNENFKEFPKDNTDWFVNSFRQDFYWWLQVQAKYEATTFSARFKINEEGLDHPAIVGSNGSYWLLSLKLSQAKTFEHLSAQLRYDLVHYNDERAKWYERDQRFNAFDPLTSKYRSDKLLSRYNHLLVGSLTVTW